VIPRRQLLTWVALPLAGNALLYLAYRDWSLWCFRWVEWGGTTEPVRRLRTIAASLGDPGEFVRFSLASGLWILGVTSFLLLVWRPLGAPAESQRADRKGRPELFGWILLILLLCIGSEAAQATGVIPGTADWSDVLAYTAGCTLALLRFGRADVSLRAWPRTPLQAHAASLAVVGCALLLATGAIFRGAF
jgi:hypothetical protein